MDVIGLTGGIAAGKSAVARRLKEHGAVVIDADRLAREVVEPGTNGLARIVERFGPSVVTAEGSLDRPALGARIFDDARARRDLNAIVHPAVQQRYAELVADAYSRDPDAIAVYDVPLLAEARATSDFGLVVVVDAPAEVRIERLVTLRGLDRTAAEARIAAQVSDEERRAMADIVIDASGSLEHTLNQADELWETLVRRRTSAQTNVGGDS